MIKLAAQNQIWMQEIDSKLAFLLNENRLVELDASYIAYKPMELDRMKIFGAKKE